MNKSNGIDLSLFKEAAKESDNHEAFQVLTALRNCRIGVGTALDSSGNYTFFIEALVTLCKGLHRVNLSTIERNLRLLRRLKKRGYTLDCEEDGCITAELAISQEDVTEECEAVGKIIESYTSGEGVIVP